VIAGTLIRNVETLRLPLKEVVAFVITGIYWMPLTQLLQLNPGVASSTLRAQLDACESNTFLLLSPVLIMLQSSFWPSRSEGHGTDRNAYCAGNAGKLFCTIEQLAISKARGLAGGMARKLRLVSMPQIMQLVSDQAQTWGFLVSMPLCESAGCPPPSSKLWICPSAPLLSDMHASLQAALTKSLGRGPSSVTLCAADVLQAPGTTVQIAMQLPMNATFSPELLAGNYGMAKQRRRWVLPDLGIFISWCTAVFQYNRPAHWPPVQELTATGYRAQIAQYVGFWAVFRNVSTAPELSVGG
jgi:hypothetical protein